MVNRISFVVFALFLAVSSIAQKDHNGNPVFNSVATEEFKLDKSFTLHCNYYTLKNNLENPRSSVYIADTLTVEDVAIAGSQLPSNFFTLTQGDRMVCMIMMINQPERKFLVSDMRSEKPVLYPCALKADIPEDRAAEMHENGYDRESRLEGAKLYFNKKEWSVISNKELHDAVVALIDREHLKELGPSNMIQPSNEQIREIIIRESAPGGKLDFFTDIKGKEMDGVQVKKGVFTTNIGLALYVWGSKVFDLGLNTIEDAYKIWSELKARPANQMEKEHIKLGFEKLLRNNIVDFCRISSTSIIAIPEVPMVS